MLLNKNKGTTKKLYFLGIFPKQDHLRMNVAPDLNNHLWPIDLFRSMIIKKNRSKACDSHRIVIE